ncbi:MAG: metal ABC transporter permease [Desulfobacterales bacterium]|nr:metal ABC transporter permease [Desulfobacterales bacterium]
MLEVLELPFMQRALLAGVMIGFLASYYGVFVVQRGLGFLGNGLAHAAFGGVALGLLLGMEPLWIAAPFTVAIAIAITWVQQRTSLASDTVIGVFFAASMAMGIVFLSLKRDYSVDAFSYLFGSILAVTGTDLWVSGLVVFFSLLCQPLWGRWAYATFDRDLARTDRVPVVLDEYLLAVLIAVTVVVAVKVVGIVLISAFLVVPAAAARLLSQRFAAMTVLSVCIGVTSVLGGLGCSYWLDLPSGATIVLLQTVIFLVSLAVSRFFHVGAGRVSL